MSKNTAKELKKLVKDFRYNELKILLTFAKRNSSGRKMDLLQRVNILIENGCPVSLAVKIHELSKKRSTTNAVTTLTTSSAASKGSDVIANGIEALSNLQTRKDLDKIVPTKPNCFNRYLSSLASTSTSGFLNNNSNSMTSNTVDIPFYPDVKFRNLPFYDFCDDLLKPLGMKDISLGSKCNTKFAKYEFFLTPQQTKMIKDSQIMIDECMIDYGVQILLRYCLLETTAEQDDNLPPKLCIHVNTKLIPLPNFIAPSHMGVEPKRPNRPLDITHACELCPMQPNVVSMNWVSDPVHNHCLTVTLCKKLNCDILLSRLKQNSTRHPDLTRALIKEKLAANTDNEISFTCLKISLICPLGKIRLLVPCRSANCSHLQCFDASTYLQMNDKKPTWICPICDKSARYDSLIIDGLFLEILSRVKDTNEIQFLEDGNWKPIFKKQQNEGKALDTSIICYEVPDSPASGGSSDTIVSAVENATGTNYTGSQKCKKEKSKEISMIDLTGDSDDDTLDVSSVDVASSYDQDVAKSKKHKKKSSSLFPKKSIIPTFVESSSLADVGLGLSNSTAAALLFGSNSGLPELDYPGSISPLLTYDDCSNPPDLYPI